MPELGTQASTPEAVERRRTRKARKRRAHRTKPRPMTSTPNATLGGAEVERSHEAAHGPISPEIEAAATGQSVKRVKKARRAARAYARHRQGLQREQAEAGTLQQQIERFRHPEEKSYDIFIDPKTGKPDRFSNYAPPLLRALQDFTGDTPLEVGANVAALMATGGVGAVAKLAGTAKVAEDAYRAEEAVKATQAARAAADAREAAAAGKAEKVAQEGRAVKKARKIKQATRTRYNREGRALRRKQRLQGAATIAAGSPAALTIAGGTVATTAEAIRQDIEEGKPLRTLGTTARVGAAIPGSIIGAAGDIVEAARTGDTAPLEGLLKQQEQYWQQIGDVASGAPGAEKIVQHDVGLLPVISGGLTGLGFAKALGGIPKIPFDLHASRMRRLAEAVHSAPTARERRAAAEELEKAVSEGIASIHRNRKRESERAAVTGEQREAHFARETKGKGRRRAAKLGRRESIVDLVGRLGRQDIDGHVSKADVIQFLGREGLSVDNTQFALREIRKRREALVDPRRDIDPDAVTTRPVIDAILRHPEVLRDPDVRRAVKGFAELQRERSVERHESRVGHEAAGGQPDPLDDPARLLHVARAEDIRTAGERVPSELQGKTKVRERRGQDALKAIRGEARSLDNRAKRLRAQADALRRSRPDRAATLEERAGRYEAEAASRREVVDRFKQAGRLELQAARLEAADPRSLEADRLLDEARQLREQGQAMEEERRRAYVDETNARIEQRGYAEPIYFRESDASDRGELNVQRNYPGAKNATKEKFRTGRLAEQGRIDESGQTLLENAYRNRAAMAVNNAALDFLSEHLLDLGEDGVSTVYRTGPEWRRLKREGKVPRGYVLVPAQEFTAAMQRGDLDAADGLIADSLKRDVQKARLAGEAQGGSKRVYGAVPESALKQFRAQAEPLTRGWRYARAVSRLQTGFMLGTSPAWFAFQLVATPLVMLARNPNPAAWVRAATKAYAIWKNAPERTRTDFRAHFGGNPSDILSLGDVQTAMKADTVRSMSDALRFAFRSPVGRMVHALGENVRKGGPLMAANRRYEGALRHFSSLLEMDRLTGLDRHGNPRMTARVRQFAEKAAGLTDTAYRHLEELRGKSAAEQAEWYTHHPDKMRELENAVNDAYGNWASLTDFEKKLGSVVVFYPFVRFSLRWLFYSFPKENPFKAAIGLNLAQANAEELQQASGGKPDFFSDWGQVVIHSGPNGEPEVGLDLSRAAPGSNAVLEALGGKGSFNLQTFLRPVQPLVGILSSALEGKDPYGNDVEGASFFDLVGRGALGLSPWTRPLRDELGPEPSDFALLFRAIEGRNGGLATSVAPRLLTNFASAQEANHVEHLLNVISKRPDYAEKSAASTHEERLKLAHRKFRADKAQKELDALLRQYGIETKAQQTSDEKQRDANVQATDDLIYPTKPTPQPWYGGGTQKPATVGSGWYR